MNSDYGKDPSTFMRFIVRQMDIANLKVAARSSHWDLSGDQDRVGQATDSVEIRDQRQGTQIHLFRQGQVGPVLGIREIGIDGPGLTWIVGLISCPYSGRAKRIQTPHLPATLNRLEATTAPVRHV